MVADSSDVSFLEQEKSEASSSDLADIEKAAQGGGAVEELERKVMELNEYRRQVQEQTADKLHGKDPVCYRGRRRRLTELLQMLNSRSL